MEVYFQMFFDYMPDVTGSRVDFENIDLFYE
jgi:hypothetical protein